MTYEEDRGGVTKAVVQAHNEIKLKERHDIITAAIWSAQNKLLQKQPAVAPVLLTECQPALKLAESISWRLNLIESPIAGAQPPSARPPYSGPPPVYDPSLGGPTPPTQPPVHEELKPPVLKQKQRDNLTKKLWRMGDSVLKCQEAWNNLVLAKKELVDVKAGGTKPDGKQQRQRALAVAKGVTEALRTVKELATTSDDFAKEALMIPWKEVETNPNDMAFVRSLQEQFKDPYMRIALYFQRMQEPPWPTWLQDAFAQKKSRDEWQKAVQAITYQLENTGKSLFRVQ